MTLRDVIRIALRTGEAFEREGDDVHYAYQHPVTDPGAVIDPDAHVVAFARTYGADAAGGDEWRLLPHNRRRST